jgi:hypothetical protein
MNNPKSKFWAGLRGFHVACFNDSPWNTIPLPLILRTSNDDWSILISLLAVMVYIQARLRLTIHIEDDRIRLRLKENGIAESLFTSGLLPQY